MKHVLFDMKLHRPERLKHVGITTRVLLQGLVDCKLQQHSLSRHDTAAVAERRLGQWQIIYSNLVGELYVKECYYYNLVSSLLPLIFPKSILFRENRIWVFMAYGIWLDLQPDRFD